MLRSIYIYQIAKSSNKSCTKANLRNFKNTKIEKRIIDFESMYKKYKIYTHMHIPLQKNGSQQL